MPQQRQKQDSMQILTDLTPDVFENTQMFHLKLTIDMSRHKVSVKINSQVVLCHLNHDLRPDKKINLQGNHSQSDNGYTPTFA